MTISEPPEEVEGGVVDVAALGDHEAEVLGRPGDALVGVVGGDREAGVVEGRHVAHGGETPAHE